MALHTGGFMAIGARLRGILDELIATGYPEQVAERIASGDLPMDTASRMQRAEAMGFDPSNVAYHGTRADITEFEPSARGKMGPGVYTSPSPIVAGSYSTPGHRIPRSGVYEDRGLLDEELVVSEGANVMPLLLRGDRMERFEALKQNPDIPIATLSEPTTEGASELAARLEREGITGLEIQGRGSDGMQSYNVREQNTFDPQNVRSLFAAFDPEYKGSNILGGTAAGALGLTALMAPEEAEAKTPEFLASLPQLEPYEPGLVDNAVQNVADFLKDIGVTESDYTANQMASSLSNLADFTPVVGDAKGFAETRDLIEEGSYGQAAVSGLLAALGLIPVGGDIAAAALKGALPLPFSVNRDTGLLQRVGDPESVNAMRLDVEPGVELAPSSLLTAEDLEGRGFVSGMADTSLGDLSRVTAVNDQSVDMVRFGGQDYMRQPQNVDQGILWASDAGAVTGLTNAAKAAANLPGVSRAPLYIPYQMGGASTDFATMTSDIMVPIARQNMKKADKKALDKRIREGAGTKTGEFKPQPDWPGIDSPKADEWLASAGGNRKAVTKAIDEYRDVAGINLSQVRAAIVDPEQLNPRVGNLRQAGVLDLMRPAQPGMHPSYNTDLMGSYLGQFGEGANLLSDLNPLIRSSGKPFVPEMIARGHNLEAAALPAPVGKAMQAGLIGAFDQATLDDLIKKGLIAP